MTIADRIKAKRIEKDLSQTDLALRAGYNNKTAISKLEHAGDDISMKQIRRVATALDVSPAYLMGWEDDKKSDAKQDQIIRLAAYADMLNALPDKEREQINEITEQLVHLTPDERASVLNLLKVLSPKS